MELLTMSAMNDTSPGTVSKILWHFTGGPRWNPERQTQGTAPKPAAAAYANLKSILRSREIRVGGYKEIVKVVLPEVRKRVWRSGEVRQVVQTDVPVTIESTPVCCLSDIPAPHLRYHAYRYGKFALGFHREAVIRAGFNPVFYTLDRAAVVRSIYQGLSTLREFSMSEIEDAVAEIKYAVDRLEETHEGADVREISLRTDVIEWEITDLDGSIAGARKSLADFVAFVKSFQDDEFGTIYCEREWRSTRPYQFGLDEVAMVVLPKSVSNQRFYRPFVERFAARSRLPRRIPIVPWEDLIEH